VSDLPERLARLEREVATLRQPNYYPAVARKRDDELSSGIDRAGKQWVGIPIPPDVSVYQPLDATLTALAGVTFGANQSVYATAADTFAVFDLSAFGRTLVDDADAATARATLGLGTIATQAANNVAITGGSISGITDLAVADGGTGASDAAGARTNLGAAASVHAATHLPGAADQVFQGSDAYTITGDTTTRAFDPTAVTLPQLGDVVATLLRDLGLNRMPRVS